MNDFFRCSYCLFFLISSLHLSFVFLYIHTLIYFLLSIYVFLHTQIYKYLFLQTVKRYFLTTASVDEMRYKSDDIFLQAAIKLNKMDFVGITEDMGTSVALLQCILGVPDVHVPKKNVGTYQPVRDRHDSLSFFFSFTIV